jgi:hypothetical protein
MPAQDTIDSNKLRFIYFVNKTFMLIDVHKVNCIMKLKDVIWLGLVKVNTKGKKLFLFTTNFSTKNLQIS